MKVKVVKRFIDKDTRKLMDVGTAKKPTIIEVTEERFNELVKAGKYVVKAEDDEIAMGTIERTASDILDDVLHDMTVEELREHAAKYGVDLTGIRNKPEIIEAIKAGRVVADSDENGASVDAQNESEATTEEGPIEDRMSLAELKTYAEEHGIELNGARTKATIADAIRAAERNESTVE